MVASTNTQRAGASPSDDLPSSELLPGQPNGHLRIRIFTSAEAEEAAKQLMASDDPSADAAGDVVPDSPEAARIAVACLDELLRKLPAFVKRALGGAERNADRLSDDRLQGLAELIQNADDVNATGLAFSIETTAQGTRLVCIHNGSPLRLRDVIGLGVPWLSMKADDVSTLGQFGIGLMTLRSLSDVLEVHSGHFHLRFESRRIMYLNDVQDYPSDGSDTVFRIPVAAEAVRHSDVSTWLKLWGDAGLLFLSSVRSVGLTSSASTDADGGSDADTGPVQLRVQRSVSATVGTAADGETVKCTVSETNGSQWLVYSREVSPDVDRGPGRPQQDTALVSVAFPLGRQEPGFLHVGLPVRGIGLPFRICAPFDPLANRRDLADTELNRVLIRAASELWCQASLDMFNTSAADAWATVPLDSELSEDLRTTGRLREALSESFFVAARTRLAAGLTFETAPGVFTPIDDIAVEHRDLRGIVGATEVAELTDGRILLPEYCRDAEDRWRAVLDDLTVIGAASPLNVGIQDALALLATEGRQPALMAALTAVGLEHDLARELEELLCIAAAEGAVRPTDLGGARMLIDANAEPIWASLGIGIEVDQDYQSCRGWTEVSTWLAEDSRYAAAATSIAALIRLGNAGLAGYELSAPLTDEQTLLLRAAIESADEDTRRRVGQGIGMAVSVDATTYDAHGKPQTVSARPAAAYLIEREPDAWSVAAGKTRGLVWVHRRYNDVLRAPGGNRTGAVGAQRLFGLLGAERAPRTVSNPQTEDRYGGRAVPRSKATTPAQILMRANDADYLVGDTTSPDLQAVLIDIAGDNSADDRRRRANAVLASLSRAWDRLPSTAQAVRAHYGWNHEAYIPSSWVLNARTPQWLSNSRGTKCAPSDLAIKTPGSMAMLGTDPTQFLHATHDRAKWHDTLLELGVQGDPAASDLVDQLRELRTRELPALEAVEAASPLYEALASHVTTGVSPGIGDLPHKAAADAFKSGTGLIATESGWLRPAQVLDGPAIFGDQRVFVPAVTGGSRLWRAVGVPRPRAEDAEQVIRGLARKKTLAPEHQLVLVEALRLLADTQRRIAQSQAPQPGPTPSRSGPRKELRRLPMWTGDGWARTRPVFAVSDPRLIDVLGRHVSVWQPGAGLHQFESLITPMALTRVNASDMSVLASARSYDEECTATFQAAVRILQKDLALNDPTVEAALSLAWDELASFEVAVCPDLSVHSALPSLRAVPKLPVRAWIAKAEQTFYVNKVDDAGTAEHGGVALAALFAPTNPREIAYPWLGAWTRAAAGIREEAMVIASRAATEKAAQRTAEGEQILQDLQRRSATQNKKSGSPGSASKDGDSKTVTTSTPPRLPIPPLPPRTLVDPSEYRLEDSFGTMLPGSGPSRPPNKPKTPNELIPPRAPGTSSTKPPAVRGHKAYTDRDREDIGMEFVRAVLGYDSDEISDIRNQHNVGADAIDKLDQFYELKVHAGSIPDQIRLTNSEVKRALTTKGFFLVLVGNVERENGEPEVRIVHDPLHHLTPTDSGSITLTGARTAKALVYRFTSERKGPDESTTASGTGGTDLAGKRTSASHRRVPRLGRRPPFTTGAKS